MVASLRWSRKASRGSSSGPGGVFSYMFSLPSSSPTVGCPLTVYLSTAGPNSSSERPFLGLWSYRPRNLRPLYWYQQHWNSLSFFFFFNYLTIIVLLLSWGPRLVSDLRAVQVLPLPKRQKLQLSLQHPATALLFFFLNCTLVAETLRAKVKFSSQKALSFGDRV